MNLELLLYTELDLLCILILIYVGAKSFNNVERRQSWRVFQCSVGFITLFVMSD